MQSEELKVVRGQDWKSLSPPQLGDWQPRLRVTVVLPARDCQDQLDLALASLSRQTYPKDLLDVVVVDDASMPPLQLPERRPERSRLVRLEKSQSHGSGRARHVGAVQGDAEVLLFLDADMVPDHRHVEAHARWHHVTAGAVVLGRKWFVDFSGITPAQVQEKAAQGRVIFLLRGRRPKRHEWQEDFIASQDDLTRDSDDAFVAVVGSTISVRRDLYLLSGGFAPFDLRGIVDTEFGYRVFTSGGLIIPDDEARAFHQGPRSFGSRGDEIKRQRTGLAANYLPIALFRPSNIGRQWAVPMVNALVSTHEARPEEVQVTVDSLLASDLSDLAVTIAGAEYPRWLRDYFGHEGRVVFSDRLPESGFPSPLSCAVPAGVVLSAASISQAVALMADAGASVLRTETTQAEQSGVEVWRTRALLRASRGPAANLRAHVCELRVPAAQIGVTHAELVVTKQGMIVAGPVRPRGV